MSVLLRYRPNTIKKVIGNNEEKARLLKRSRENDWNENEILEGPFGVGKGCQFVFTENNDSDEPDVYSVTVFIRFKFVILPSSASPRLYSKNSLSPQAPGFPSSPELHFQQVLLQLQCNDIIWRFKHSKNP